MFSKSRLVLTNGRLSSLRSVRFLNKNIPSEPIISPKPIPVKIDDETIRHLERLSLVDFANEEGVRRLESAIAFANPIKDVDTTGIEPMYSVLDAETLRLRDDVVSEGNIRSDILSNAVLSEEDYFVAPPGNIPLKIQKNKYRNESQRSEKKN